MRDFLAAHRNLTVHNFRVERQSENSEILRKVLNPYRSFLYSLREHLDDCFHIVKTFVPPKVHFHETRNQYNWLNNNPTGDAVKRFLQSLHSYKVFLDQIVNQLKHRNAVLAWICFIDPQIQDFVLGYYIANVKDGRFQPVERIHTKFKGEHTAFSFGRDIRFNIFHVFRISEELIALIQRLGIATPRAIKASEPAEQRKRLYENVCELPKHVFPDEQVKEVVDIWIKEGQLVFEYPAPIVLPVRRHRLAVLSFAGDGLTRNFVLLYFTDRKS